MNASLKVLLKGFFFHDNIGIYWNTASHKTFFQYDIKGRVVTESNSQGQTYIVASPS